MPWRTVGNFQGLNLIVVLDSARVYAESWYFASSGATFLFLRVSFEHFRSSVMMVLSFMMSDMRKPHGRVHERFEKKMEKSLRVATLGNAIKKARNQHVQGIGARPRISISLIEAADLPWLINNPSKATKGAVDIKTFECTC